MIPAERAHYYVVAKTDDGKEGKNNEDSFSVTAYKLSETDDTPVLFAIVADGIGGRNAGEVAAGMAVEMISEAVADSDASQPAEIMQAAIIQASKAIHALGVSEGQKKSMGTTCVCTWIVGDKLYIAYAGNSRLYMIRGKKMHQVTIDHTWVQEAVDAGALTPAQARIHPNANIIRRHLGDRKGIEVDLRLKLSPDDSNEKALGNQGAQMLPGDRLLLTTDGLTDLVDDTQIYKLIAGNSIEEAAQKLIDAANDQGGKDNITIAIIEVPGAEKRVKLPFVS